LWDIKTYDVTTFFANGTNDLILTSPLYHDDLSLVAATLSFPAGGANNSPVFGTTNLLLNPGAETGTLTNWITGGSSNPNVDNGTFDVGINPNTGGYDFYGGSGAHGSLSQTVSLVGNQGITAAMIDNSNLAANISFWEQGLSQGTPSDDANITLTFLGASSNVLTTVNTPVIDSHNNTWSNYVNQYAIPAGTRFIQYTMNFYLNQGGDLDAFVDDNYLSIVQPLSAAAASPTISGPAVYGNLVTTTPNLLGYWPFSVASQANSSVNGYTGTFIGNAAIGPAGSGPALVNGLDNTAVVLDGTNSYVDTTLVGGLSTTGTNANQGSIVAWFKLAALPSNIGHFFSIAGESQTGNDFDLQIETDNELKFYTDSGSATVDTTAFTTNDLNVWHFAAATFTGGTSRNLYLDGQLVASSTPGSHNPATGGTFAMGYSDAFSGRYFSGNLDEIAVFNRQLTGSEVTNFYAAAVLPAFSSPAQNVTVTNGDPVSFTITASGATPLFYQWQKNGINLADGGNISGSDTNTLNLSVTSTNDDGNYFVIITNAYGSVTSSVVTLTVIVPVGGSTNVSATNLIVLHTFSTLNSSTNADGAVPQANLILSGNTLFGTAYYGGTSGYGAVFKVNTDGTGFTNLYSFTNGSDGAYPSAGLILSGNTLYGTASAYLLGGKWGTVFAINTNGTGFTNLYNFTAGRDGGYPVGSLILSGNTLYGTAAGAGRSPYGTIFAVNTNGTGFANLYSFTDGSDGAYPNAELILSGNTLYGTALQGGSSGYGTVFAVNTNGTGFTNLYTFTNGNDGANPVDSLILSGGTLYGTAANGGSSGYGTVFAVNTNGTGFTNLYTFTDGNDGAHPDAGLILSGNTLYGTARNGGTNNEGTVFAVNTNGTGFTNLYGFTDGGDGANPQASLILSGNILYGTAANGGTNGEGTVFGLMISNSGPSPVQIISPQVSGGNFNLSFQSVNGQGYTLYYNDNLATTNWLPYTNVSGNGGTLQLSVPVTNSAQRFFRISEP
ncbi:MAG TPA: choice-of-anchor tandem repeat GloVer-containing protein, partial [Verrucomicrobiae bacterium]